MPVRFLHLADTHIGAHHPGRAAGDPYVTNMRRALAPARDGLIDLVIHGGDLFNRSRPPVRRLACAAALLTDAADGGAEVVIVPGNHERALIPARLLLAHPRIHLIEGPARIRLDLDGLDLAIFGFPFIRKDPRGAFEPALLAAGWRCGSPGRRRGSPGWRCGSPGWRCGRAAVNVLACHQTFDSATVGPRGFTFRRGPDVIPRAFVPREFDYAALGHIHRHQILDHPDPAGPMLAYPGSTERTSRAERNEEKGVIHGAIDADGRFSIRFVTLPAAPIPSGAPGEAPGGAPGYFRPRVIART